MRRSQLAKVLVLLHEFEACVCELFQRSLLLRKQVCQVVHGSRQVRVLAAQLLLNQMRESFSEKDHKESLDLEDLANEFLLLKHFHVHFERDLNCLDS